MAALEPHYMGILKRILNERFEPFLPPLLDKRKPAAEQLDKQLSRAFGAFALHKLLDLTPQAAAASVVDDFNDRGIDAIHYHESSGTLYLLQAKLKDSEQFKQEDALAFCEGVRLLFQEHFTAFNANVQQRQSEIEGWLDECSHIKLVVPYTGHDVSIHAADALQKLLNDEGLDEKRLIKEVQYYAAADIARDLLAEQAYLPVHAEIFLQKCSNIEEPRTTYYGTARLADLIALHRDHGKALYERNIRYFLGSGKSDVNAAIKTTLRDDPGSFFYLNNGVTAVCEEVEPKRKNPRNGFRKYKVRGLSIINGAQTVASAAEFVAQNPKSNIDNAKVMFTLIKAPSDGSFGKQVTKARNHQNPVQAANFASLDENQERLRQEIAHLGFDYHYRPEAQLTSTTAITLDEALRALALRQSDPRYVVWLRSEPGRFSNPESAEYQTLFPGTLSGTALVNTVLSQRAMRSLLVAYEQQAPARSQEKLIYRHGIHAITAVMMKRLRELIDMGGVLDSAKIRQLISQPLDQLRQNASDLWQQQSPHEGPLAFFRAMEFTMPFLIDLMKKEYKLESFQVETNPERLGRLALDGKSLNQDLAERLSKAAPQLKESKK